MSSNSSFNAASVGSKAWMGTEVDRARQQAQQDVEDFAYATRRELEFIAEYMRDLTDTKDLATLLQTPGRLKGALSPRKQKMLSIQQSNAKLSGGHVHFDQSPIRIDSPYRVHKSPAPQRSAVRNHPARVAALSNIDLSHPQQQENRDTQMEEREDERSLADIQKMMQENREKQETEDDKGSEVRNLTDSFKAPEQEQEEKQSQNLEDEPAIDKSEEEEPGKQEDKEKRESLSAAAATPAANTHISSIYESDSESNDEDTPAVNKSSFGFTGLPKKEPVVKKSFAKTPSTAFSISKTETTMVSRLFKEPESFGAKLSGSDTTVRDSGSQTPSFKTARSDSRVSVHYPKIEPQDQKEGENMQDAPEPEPEPEQKQEEPEEEEEPLSSPFNPNPTPKPQTQTHADDDNLELTPPSGYHGRLQSPVRMESPSKESPSKESPSKESPSKESPSKASSRIPSRDISHSSRQTSQSSQQSRQTSHSAKSPSKLPQPQKSPSRPSPIRQASQSIRQASRQHFRHFSRSKSPEKAKSPEKSESPSKSQQEPSSFFALANGVFQSAKNMFSRGDSQSPERGASPERFQDQTEPEQKNMPNAEEPKTVKKQNDTISRLMAPTYASSTRSARTGAGKTGIPSPTKTIEAMSPLAEKKSIYPEAPKYTYDKNKPPVLASSSPVKATTNTATKTASTPAASRGLTSKELAKGKDDGQEKKTAKAQEPDSKDVKQPAAKQDSQDVKKQTAKQAPQKTTKHESENEAKKETDSETKTAEETAQANDTKKPTRVPPSTEQPTRLTKQPLQAKKQTPASKPVHVKVPTAANRDNSKTTKPPASTSTSTSTNSSRLSNTSSLSNTSLPKSTKVVRKQESQSTLKASKPVEPKHMHSSKNAQTSQKSEAPKTLKRNPQLEAESTRKQVHSAKSKQELQSSTFAKKRTSDQAALDSPLEKKATRVSQLTMNKTTATTNTGAGAGTGSGYAKKPSLMKSTVMQQAKAANTNTAATSNMMPQVDGVKFSNDSLKFASNPPSGAPSASSSRINSVAQPQQPQPQPQPQQYQPPPQQQQPKMQANPFRQLPTVSMTNNPMMTPANNNRQQENVELPEIMSESEDDDEDSVLQDWASTPELRNQMLQQQHMNPDSVFGPPQPLHLEEVFHSHSSRLSKFRPRSSSANWTRDKLSKEEIERHAQVMGYQY